MQLVFLSKIKATRFFVLAVLLSLTSLTGAAQAQNTVTIKFDDRDGVTGELLEFSNDVFKLETTIGQVTIPAEGVFCVGLACPEATRLEIVPSPMVLTSLDGTITLSGDLIDVIGGQYVLATDVGELRIATGDVTCVGDGCVGAPSEPSFGGEVALTSGTTTIEGTLTELEQDSYLVEVESLGVIRVNRDQFQCKGAGCPAE